MESSKLSPDERELIMSVTDSEAELCVTSSSPAYTKQLTKIAKAMGRDILHLDPYTIRVYLPRACVVVREPPKARTLTAAQRQAASQRMKTMRTTPRAQVAPSDAVHSR